MENRLTKYAHTLWVLAALFAIARYLCAAVAWAGSRPDRATFQTALDSLGPFLPTMTIICLLGGLLIFGADLFIAITRKK